MAAPPVRRRSFDRSIVEGPIPRAVWRIAWPTMLQNIISGLQGMVDHVMVGHYVGYQGNAAIGVAWQIFLVVIIFISSLFTGMAVLVARFAGHGDHDKVNRAVYQAFLTACFLSVAIFAPVGWLLAPDLLDLVNAAPAVQAEALPYLRIMFVASIGMMLFYMLGGAFRAAGDAQTPLRLGVVMTVLNVVLNVILIAGVGPIPALGTTGAALGTVISGGIAAAAALYLLLAGKSVIALERGMSWRPDWAIIRQLFRFGIPTGLQGIAMNVAGVFLLRFVGSLGQSAAAQAAYAVGYTELFSLITWTSVGLMGAAATVAGQNLGAGHPDRSVEAVHVAARYGLAVAATMGVIFVAVPRVLLGVFGMEAAALEIGVELLRYLSVSGLFIAVALTYTGGLQGTGDTRGPFYISVVSQIVVPLGLCAVFQATTGLEPARIWLAIVLGHATRCALSIGRFRQGAWRKVTVEI